MNKHREVEIRRKQRGKRKVREEALLTEAAADMKAQRVAAWHYAGDAAAKAIVKRIT